MTNALEEFKDVNDARIFAENAIATVREPLLVLDGELRVVFANEAFYAKFQVTRKESEGALIYELGNGQWNIPKLREALEKIIPHESHFDDYEVEHSFPQIGQKIMLLNGRQVQQAGERKKFILLAIEDVTDRIMTKRKLQESEKKFRGFIQTINSIILRFNSEGKITFFNHFSEQLFGYSEKELLGKPMVGTIIPEKDEEGRDQQAMVQGAIEHPEQYYFKQTEGRKKNGGKVWFQWSAKETRDEHGKVTEILIDGNDITGEMEYRRMLQDIQGLAESSPDIMARFDHDMRLAYGNPLFIRLLGRSRNEVIGKTLREIGLPEEKASQLEDEFRKAKGEQGHEQAVIELHGHAYRVQIVAEDKQRPSLKLYAADISDRKKMEDDLRRNEYELKSVVENTPDIYFRMNRQQQYVFVNPTYERLTGLMKEQFIGKTNRQLGMSGQMVQFWQSAVQEASENGKEHTVEFEMSGLFGKRYFSARVIPEFEKTGLVETVLVVARDITDTKHFEEKVAALKK